MNRKSLTIAATTVTAVSSAVLVAKKVKNNKKDEKVNTYRNTELGKYEQTEQNPSKYDTASWMSPFAFSEAFRLYL